jgi:hypothetical protein
MNLSHAATNGLGVLRFPNPYTVRPDSRIRPACRVKSLSLDSLNLILILILIVSFGGPMTGASWAVSVGQQFRSPGRAYPVPRD